MFGLAFTITDAGRAALINAQNTGVDALVIHQIGVSPAHTAGALAALVALPGETKRLATFAGDVVADDTLHATLRDESADAYSLRAFGVYLSDGTLFGIYSQAEPILEKSAASMLLLAIDVILTALDTAEITFGATDFINPPATVATPGVVELATAAETLAGLDSVRAVTPFSLKAALQSWAAGFAALVHGHVIGDIAGLAAALAGKAAAVHTHAAADTVSGVFDIARVPDLAMGRITGLIAALTGKSAVGHSHDAGDTVSGVFSVARIPALAMTAVTGLVDALAGKAAAVHQHAAADITSGVFSVLRVPDLAMAKILGLADALAGKADLSGADFGSNPVRGRLEHADGVLRINPSSGLYDDGSWVQVSYDGVQRRLEFVQATSGAGGLGLTLYIPGRGYVWDQSTFDPASKANVGHTHAAADVVSGVFALARIPEVPITGVAGLQPALDAKASLSGADFGNNELRGSLVHSRGYLTIEPYDGAADDNTWARAAWNGTQRRLEFSHGTGGPGGAALVLYIPGRGLVWDQSTFNPALKADVASPALSGAPTAPTPTAADNSTRIATTAFVQAVVGERAGAIDYFAASTAPSGYLKANGAAVSRATYAALYAAIGTTFGVGNGATTFNLPDLRAEFVRGLDDGRGIDSGRTLGSFQGSQNLAHDHSIPSRTNQGTDAGYVEDADSGGSPRAASTGSSGGSEARPRNIALLACIKF